ncbi:hypothetical protein M406DRAFT_334139 [Cryphonectria parasitica EP155]|uniref:DUF8032 domain-containing protein n=1 Tax=Cryphonectria parasitica (strain ATCC 38755 / EP155) TaxID=660469 RepID=A0A9P5CK22_CRYP1|nr:uncharacterized protein M406DRAFT_334139 [Cryphonectria parasitica EP155]KAF3760506.1 hypothetical protein M406DRAFT_334139 [Cryphonectria parasitica EP155]
MVLVHRPRAPRGPESPPRIIKFALHAPTSADKPPTPWMEFDYHFASPLPHHDDDDDNNNNATTTGIVSLAYTIRCDVSTVKMATLLAEFKQRHALYPMEGTAATGMTEEMRREHNEVAWALTALNPILRGRDPQKPDLLRRAVECWMVVREDVERVKAVVASSSHSE